MDRAGRELRDGEAAAMTCPITRITIEARLLSPSKHSWIAEPRSYDSSGPVHLDIIEIGFSPAEAIGKVALELERVFKMGAASELGEKAT